MQTRIHLSLMRGFLSATILLCTCAFALPDEGANSRSAALHYIDTSFENASPLYWATDPEDDARVHIYLSYDHERCSPNRAAGHWHFKVESAPGEQLTLVLHNFQNIWNGRPGSFVSEKTACFISDDGKAWRRAETQFGGDDNSLAVRICSKNGTTHVARIPPYTLNDLQSLLEACETSEHAQVVAIGKTVQGRTLEMVRVGDADAPHSVVLRARAHPWESGGSWVVDATIRRMMRDDEDAKRWRSKFALYVLPMANKDGVAAGRTRFNMRGMDLNRKWDKPADPELCPENAAIERWLASMIGKGKRPNLLIDFHNDAGGRLHWGHPSEGEADDYYADMQRFEDILRANTWFREGHHAASFQNPGAIYEGMLTRYGIPAFVHELNADYIEGVDSPPSIEHWRRYGEALPEVFSEYFAERQEN